MGYQDEGSEKQKLRKHGSGLFFAVFVQPLCGLGLMAHCRDLDNYQDYGPILGMQ